MWLRTGARYLRGVLQALRSRVGGRGVAPDSKPSPEPYLPPSPSLSASAPDVLDGMRIASALEETLRKSFAVEPTSGSIVPFTKCFRMGQFSASAVEARRLEQSLRVHEVMAKLYDAQAEAYLKHAMGALTSGSVVEEVRPMHAWIKDRTGVWHDLLANPEWCRVDTRGGESEFGDKLPPGPLCEDCKAYLTSRVVES